MDATELEESGEASSTGMFRSLRIRNFRLYLTSQLASTIGIWMQTTALSWLVLHLSGNKGVAVGLVLALRYLPTALLSAWAGVLADRFDKWRLLLVSQGVVALCAAGLAVVDLTGVVELWMVLLLVAGSGLGTAFDMPVRNAFVMEMVGPRDVVNAVGLNSAVFNGARMFGPALAGIVIVAFGTGVCFAVNALSFVVVITMFFMMRTGELHRMPRAAPAKGQVWEGMRYIWRNRELRVLILLMGTMGLLVFNTPVIYPVLAKLTFHGDATTFGLMSLVSGAGALVGSLYAARRTTLPPELLLAAGVALGAMLIGCSLSPTLGILLPFLFATGAAQMTFLTSVTTTVQLDAEPHMLGRVMALYVVASVGTVPIGSLMMGWIAQHASPRWALFIGGAGVLVSLGFAARAVLARRTHAELAAQPLAV